MNMISKGKAAFGGRIAKVKVAAGILFTTPAYLDPDLMLVGDVIGSAYVAGAYPAHQGNPVSEINVKYYVNDVEVAPTYVLQTGDLVGQARVYLQAGTVTDNYYSAIEGIVDYSYDPGNLEWQVPPGSGDVTPPTIVSTIPGDNEVDAAVAASIVITFSETVVFGTGLITLRHNNGAWADLETFDVATEQGTGNGQVSISTNTLTINPTASMAFSREHAIRIAGTAIKDVSNNAFAGIANDTTLSFTTEAAPAIASSAPADNATGVSVGTSPTITFNKSVAFGTGNIVLRENISGTWSDLEVFDVATEQGAGNGQVEIAGAVLTINPTAPMTAGREYAIQIAGTAITDTTGNAFAGIANDTTISFTTASTGTIQYVGQRSAGGTGGLTVSLTTLLNGIGTTALENDLVIAFGGKAHNADQDITAAGWTEIADIYVNDANDVNLGVFYKFMTATPDTSVTVGTGGTSTNGGVAVAAVFRGVNLTTPFDVTFTSAQGIDGNLADPPAITPITAGAWIMAIYAGSNDSTVTNPTPPANVTDFFWGDSPGTTTRLQIGFGLKKDWVSGAFDPDPWSGTNNEATTAWLGISIALRPA